MKKIYSMLMLLCAGIGHTQAQLISGKVVDEERQPLMAANVVLLALPDSVYIDGAITDSLGGFSIRREMTTERKTLLQVSYIGYQTLYAECAQSEMGTLQLAPDARLMGEVVVKSTLPKTRIKGDAMVTNVAGTVLEKAGTAENLLDRVPGVSAKNGAVSVFGRGQAEVYINGRKVRNATELEQLQADNIKSVEVVDNPGARYDASVRAVVRILTKKPQGEGFSFHNRAYVRYDKKWAEQEQLDMNYRKGGFDIGAMLFGNDMRNWYDKKITTNTYLDKFWKQQMDIYETEHIQNYQTSLMANYASEKGHSVGARYDYSHTPRFKTEHTLENTTWTDDTPDEWMENPGGSDMQQKNHQLNAYYSGKLKGWTIDFNADGYWSNRFTKTFSDETLKDIATDAVKEMRHITTTTDDENSLYAAKLIFGHPLWGGALSFGSEASRTETHSTYLNPEGILDNNRNEIREASASAFAEYSRTFGKLTARAGLRYEHINSDYYEAGQHMDEESRTYNDLFPSLSLTMPIRNAQMRLSYSRDISRPGYSVLRNRVTYANRYTYSSGNPYLKPSLTDNLMLNATYKWMQFRFGYQHIKDARVYTTESYRGDPTIAVLKHTNAPAYDQLNIGVVLSPTIAIWTPQFSAGYMQNWFEAETPWGKEMMNNPIVQLKWQNSLQLPGDFFLSADAAWTSRGDNENTAILSDRWSVDLMLHKAFFRNRLTVQLRGSDLVNGLRSRSRGYFGPLRTMENDNFPSPRSVSLTLRYNFNTAKDKYRGTGAGSSQKRRF